MSFQRHIRKIVTTAPPEPGFAGPGHEAVEVVAPGNFAETDPFIVLMDDRVADRRGATVGDAHPHAGIETVTFVLTGNIKDGDAPALAAGDVQWMTAGNGVIHDEDMEARGDLRILQLWVTLPKATRTEGPHFQDVHGTAVPVRREGGAEVRLYSGASGGLVSPTRNEVPVTLADISLTAGATIGQDLPASFNGFVYVLEGSVTVGDDDTVLRAGQVGWLDRPERDGQSQLKLAPTEGPARLILYAGEPQREEIFMRGPFVGLSPEELSGYFRTYRAGQFPRMSQLAKEKYGEAA